MGGDEKDEMKSFLDSSGIQSVRGFDEAERFGVAVRYLDSLIEDWTSPDWRKSYGDELKQLACELMLVLSLPTGSVHSLLSDFCRRVHLAMGGLVLRDLVAKAETEVLKIWAENGGSAPVSPESTSRPTPVGLAKQMAEDLSCGIPAGFPGQPMIQDEGSGDWRRIREGEKATAFIFQAGTNHSFPVKEIDGSHLNLENMEIVAMDSPAWLERQLNHFREFARSRGISIDVENQGIVQCLDHQFDDLNRQLKAANEIIGKQARMINDLKSGALPPRPQELPVILSGESLSRPVFLWIREIAGLLGIVLPASPGVITEAVRDLTAQPEGLFSLLTKTIEQASGYLHADPATAPSLMERLKSIIDERNLLMVERDYARGRLQFFRESAEARKKIDPKDRRRIIAHSVAALTGDINMAMELIRKYHLLDDPTHDDEDVWAMVSVWLMNRDSEKMARGTISVTSDLTNFNDAIHELPTTDLTDLKRRTREFAMKFSPEDFAPEKLRSMQNQIPPKKSDFRFDFTICVFCGTPLRSDGASRLVCNACDA